MQSQNKNCQVIYYMQSDFHFHISMVIGYLIAKHPRPDLRILSESFVYLLFRWSTCWLSRHRDERPKGRPNGLNPHKPSWLSLKAHHVHSSLIEIKDLMYYPCHIKIVVSQSCTSRLSIQFIDIKLCVQLFYPRRFYLKSRSAPLVLILIVASSLKFSESSSLFSKISDLRSALRGLFPKQKLLNGRDLKYDTPPTMVNLEQQNDSAYISKQNWKKNW